MIADTSVLLRLVVLEDDPAKSADVQALVRLPVRSRYEIEVLPTTLSEMVFVLKGARVGYSRAQVAETLRKFVMLPLLIHHRTEMLFAIELYADHHNDWEDCVAAAFALQSEGRILAYDRGFRRIPGLVRFEPPVIAS